MSIELKTKMLGYSATRHKDTPKPSLYTSPLARFGIDPVIPGSDALPMAVAFAEARCEIQSREIPRPTTMRLVGDTLVLLGSGGWKEQSGIMSIRNLASGDEDSFFSPGKSFSLGRRGGSQLVIDDTRKLVYNDAGKGINAYRYGSQTREDEDVAMDAREEPGSIEGSNTEAIADGSSEDSEDQDDDDVILGGQDEDKRVAFSFSAEGYEGALGLASGGEKLLRTGKKGLGVWKVPSRGMGGKTHFVSLVSPAFASVEVMAEHPSHARQRLVATCSGSYFVSSADIETGLVTSRYVGHNREVTAFATSADDSNNFITASSDGGVRFYDSRLPAPIYAIEHSHAENLQTVLYEHIGGYPCELLVLLAMWWLMLDAVIIIGGFKSQQVKIWDARGRNPLYELSTGNNVVEVLAWDRSRNQLLAATDCEYLDFHGSSFDYREADFGDDSSGDMAWPEKAYHDEESFGYPFDCGSHRLRE